MTRSYRVTAQWDDEASVWVATSDDVVGLVTEAPTLDQLHERVIAVAPELLDDNGMDRNGRGTIEIHIISQLRAAE